MPKYRVKYVYETWYDVDIIAKDEDDALEIFHAGNFEDEPRRVGGELQDSIQIKEVKNGK